MNKGEQPCKTCSHTRKWDDLPDNHPQKSWLCHTYGIIVYRTDQEYGDCEEFHQSKAKRRKL